MDLRANAIITAIDRFSGPVTRMAGALNGLTGRAAGMVRSAGRATRALQDFGASAGVPSSLIAGLAMKGEYDIDRLSRQMQSVGELSKTQRKMLVDNAFETGVEVGHAAEDLLKAQRELIQGGLDPDTVARTTGLIGKAAKSNAMELSTVAEDAINVARGLGFAFDTTEEKTASLTRALEFMSVVPALSTETWEGLRESLKYSAPVASMLKIRVEELGAALSILADRGFKGEEGGTAFRTILLRGIAPTRKLADAYRAAGIHVEDLYDLDEGMIADRARLRERLLAAGFAGREEDIDAALKQVGGPERYDGLYAWQDALQERLTERLGVEDAQDRRVLKKALDQHIFSALKDFNLTKFFEAIRRLPLADFKEVAGIQRTSQARALLEDLERLEPLTEAFEKLIPGAVERRFEVMNEGFAQSVDRLVASFRKLRHALFDSGLGDDLASWFSGIADSVKKFAESDPEALGLIAKGGLLAALAAGIGAIASSPIALAVAGIAALAAAMGNIDPKKGAVGTLLDSMGDAAAGKKDSGLLKWWNWINEKMLEAPTINELLFGEGAKDISGNEIKARREEALRQYRLRQTGGRFDFGVGQGMVRDIAPTAGPQTVDVTGKVDANVKGTVSGKMEIDVKVKGPGEVTDKRGGEVSGTLNTGKTMPDAGGR